MTLLSVKDLSISFSSTAAVNNISFHVNEGEAVGIVGESGSGKTVTALSIMKLLSSEATVKGDLFFTPSSSAEINLGSVPSKEMFRYRGKHIGMVFQEPMTSLNPVFSCGEQVAEALRFHKKISLKESKVETLSLFDKVRLSNPTRMYDAYPHQLSGGEKQRVLIAMSICNNPSLIIADEPTSSLDVTVQSAILKLLHDLQTTNKMGMIFITHDLGVVSEIANRILVMYRGNIVEEGFVDKIFNEPQHPYTKALLACRPPLHKRLHYLPTIDDFIQDEKNKPDIDKKNNIGITEVTDEKIYSSQPLLSVQNVSVKFLVRKSLFAGRLPHVNAVNNVSFDLYPGETIGLVGESGSGKTTLGRAILRLINPDSGKVIFNGKDLSSLKPDEIRRLRKDMQIIFQDPYSSLNPHLPIGTSILEPMKVYKLHQGKTKSRAIELLEMVGLNETHFNRYPHEFSGGQRQRICIARALATEPAFLICDECVSALDVSLQAQILDLLKSLKKNFRFSCIFISHDLSVVRFMSDRIIVMKGGGIEEMGAAEKICDNPQSEYTRNLIESIPGSLKSRT